MAASSGSTTYFTVEQLAMIKRLRQSGISKEEIVYMFDSYDRLDRELGPLYNIPVAMVRCLLTLLDHADLEFFRVGIAGNCSNLLIATF